MKKIHKVAMALTLMCTLGLTYAILMLKGMPDVFDWDDDEDI